MILKSFKFRIYPNQEQEILLNKTFGSVRFVWNKKVENFNSYDAVTNPKPEKITSKILKDAEEFEWLNEVSAAALQQKEMDFEETTKQFFNKKRKVKIGRPKFKNRTGKQSYRLPGQKFTLIEDSSLIRLEKIGKVKIILDRKIPDGADLRSVTVSKDPSGKYYASVLLKVERQFKPLIGNRIGIDMGLKDLFIFSDGESIDNPKFFRESQAKLKKAQQHLSRKKKGSKRRDNQRIKVAKIHRKISNQRKDLLHKVSTRLVNENDVICIEDLNVSGMVKNHCLSKSISDASWSSFVNMLEYKCDWYGKTLVKIDRFYPSSKTCSCCGYKMDSMDMSVREWVCPSCGIKHDRDINAAINILNKGFSDLTGEPIEFEFASVSEKLASVECTEYRRGEDVSLRRLEPTSTKRLENQCCSSL